MPTWCKDSKEEYKNLWLNDSIKKITEVMLTKRILLVWAFKYKQTPSTFLKMVNCLTKTYFHCQDQCVRASVWVFFVRDEDRSVVVSSSGQKKKVLCPKNAKNEKKVKAKRSWQLTTAFTYSYFTDFMMGWNDFLICILAPEIYI